MLCLFKRLDDRVERPAVGAQLGVHGARVDRVGFRVPVVLWDRDEHRSAWPGDRLVVGALNRRRDVLRARGSIAHFTYGRGNRVGSSANRYGSLASIARVCWPAVITSGVALRVAVKIEPSA